MSWRKYIGPGPIVAAAFIGPGTVTVCTLAGVNFGFDLLWAMALSVIASSRDPQRSGVGFHRSSGDGAPRKSGR